MGALAAQLQLGQRASVLQWQGLAETMGGRYGVEPALILAVIEVESGGNPRAANPADPSYGLMQLLLSTARELAGNANLSPDDLYDPNLNVDLGTRYLAHQLSRYGGDYAQAISAYNAGTATPRNQTYVHRVLAALERYRVEPTGGVPSSGDPWLEDLEDIIPTELSSVSAWVWGAGVMALILAWVFLRR